jgi:hypothetical protein
MRSAFVSSVLATLVYSFCLDPASAQEECDILKFKDQISHTKDVVTNLAFISKSTERRDQASNPNFALSFLDIVSLGFNDAQKAASSLEKLLDIKYSQSDKQWLLISQLSATGQAAYSDCLKSLKQNFSVVLSDNAAFKRQFFVIVSSHPFFPAPNPQILAVSMLGGKVPGKVPSTIQNQSKIFLAVQRDDLYEPLN